MINLSKQFFLTAIFFTGLLSSCNAKSNKTGESTAGSPTPAAQSGTANQDWQNTPGLYAIISTPTGQIVCELEYKKAPVTVASFVGLAQGTIQNTFKKSGEPYFDGLTFHRVEPGFVIQGGDPAGNGSGGPGYQFANEIAPGLKHDKAGTLAMANAGPNTNGSQFYITLAPTPSLDGSYNVFGYVVSGMDVVQGITKGEKIESVKILRVGDDANAFDAPKTFEGKALDPAKAQAEQAKNMEAQKEEFKKKYAAHIDELVKANAGYQADWDTKVKAQYPTAKKTKTGLYYIIETPGTGPKAQQFQNLQVHCTGTLWDGTKFYSTYDGAGQPLPLMLGVGKVIPGWDEGLTLLGQGGKAKLIIPFYLAYGDQGMGDKIPAKSDLVFDVEVMDVK
jgi:peptidyl-prolyl cis-trans isomerase A (cyclophilin A)